MEQVAEKCKQTEIGLIPSDWEVKSLGDIFEFKNGINKGKKYFGEGTPIVNYMDVYKYNGLFAKDIIGKVTVSKQELKNYSVQKGDVFFTRTSETIEEVGITSTILDDVKDTVFSGFILRARPKNDLLDNNYKKYCFSTENARREITSKASYTTRALTNGRILSQVKIPLPQTKAEQTAIATALSDADSYIGSLEKLIAKKRLIKQGAMQKLLQPTDGWVVKKLGELFEITSSKRVFQSEWKKEGIPFYRARELAVLGEKCFVENELFITKEMYESYKKQYGVPEIGDMLVTGVGTLGKTFVVNDNSEFYFKDGNIIWFKIRGSINSNFLKQLFLTKLITKQIEDSSAGTTVGTYTISGAKRTIVHIPTIEEQTNIAAILNDMDNEIQALETQLAKAQKIKQGMMQQLLTGKIRLI